MRRAIVDGSVLATALVLAVAALAQAQDPDPDPGERLLLGVTLSDPSATGTLQEAVMEGSAVISAVPPGAPPVVGYEPTPEEVAAAWGGPSGSAVEILDPQEVGGLDLRLEAAYTPGAFGTGGEYVIVGAHDEADLSVEQPLVVVFLDAQGATLHELDTTLFIGPGGLGSAAGFVDPGGVVGDVVARPLPISRAWRHPEPTAYGGWVLGWPETKQDDYATAQTTFCVGSDRSDITFDESFLVAYRDVDGSLLGGGRAVAPFILPGDECNPVRFTFLGQLDPTRIVVTEIIPLQRPEQLRLPIVSPGSHAEGPDLSGLVTAPGSTIDEPFYLGIVPAGEGVDRASLGDLTFPLRDAQDSTAIQVWDPLASGPIAFGAAFTQRLPEAVFDSDGIVWLDLALGSDSVVVADPARAAIHRFAPESLDHLSETTYTDADGEPILVPQSIDILAGGTSYVITDASTTDDGPGGATLPIEPGPGMEVFSGTDPVGDFVDVTAGTEGFAVVDEPTHSIHVYGGENELIASFGERGSEPGQFESPRGAHLTADGTLLVADTGNDRVQAFSLVDGEATYLYSIGEGGDHPVPMEAPVSVTTDPAGNFVIGDELGMVITSAGIPLAFGVFGPSVPLDDGDAIEPGNLFTPPDLRISPDGWVYHTDPAGRLIRSFGASEATSALFGYPDPSVPYRR